MDLPRTANPGRWLNLNKIKRGPDARCACMRDGSMLALNISMLSVMYLAAHRNWRGRLGLWRRQPFHGRGHRAAPELLRNGRVECLYRVVCLCEISAAWKSALRPRAVFDWHLTSRQ
jgi:hypothetical protein